MSASYFPEKRKEIKLKKMSIHVDRHQTYELTLVVASCNNLRKIFITYPFKFSSSPAFKVTNLLQPNTGVVIKAWYHPLLTALISGYFPQDFLKIQSQ